MKAKSLMFSILLVIIILIFLYLFRGETGLDSYQMP